MEQNNKEGAKMKVTLLSYTPNARELLLLTKQTRLTKSVQDSLEDIQNWSEERKQSELDYMLKTIQSSWEFVDYTFLIEGVSRAFTHQFVRTRTGSYAQQSQRTVEMEDFGFVIPENISNNIMRKEAYNTIMEQIQKCYTYLINYEDTPPQDARGILPTNIETSIVAKFNLRTLSDMAHKRLCPRTQGEYQKVFKAMRAKIISVHPYFEKFLRVFCATYGVCQFPNFKECPIKGKIFNPETGYSWNGNIVSSNLGVIQSEWENMDFEATPKWKGNS